MADWSNDIHKWSLSGLARESHTRERKRGQNIRDVKVLLVDQHNELARLV